MASSDERGTAEVLGAAMLYCESCDRETMHRIVRLDRSARAGADSVRGTARCRECRWTHRFVSARPARRSVEVIVSSGGASERRVLELVASEPLRVGEPLAGGPEGSIVRRIDRSAGGSANEALVREVRTVWISEERPPSLRVAVMDGARSTTERVVVDPKARLEVGGSLRTRFGEVAIVGLRARQRTWRRLGDAFPAGEVTVVYARRSVRPPAGSRPWRRDRETPSSRASSTSRSPRSRSSPGRSRNRAVPRLRTASGGATERNSSFS
jgi:uncharacterized Zn finger protein